MAEVVKFAPIFHLSCSDGLPAASWATLKPAKPLPPGVKAQALPSAGFVHVATCARIEPAAPLAS
jgi:hypothetical protein